MCNTKTADVENTIKQIISLQNAGCDIVRFAVNSATDAAAIKEIKNATDIPLVADIQYDYKLAVLSAENGIDKVRINPGNIGDERKVRYLADVLKERKIPIRIGVNTGSLEKDLKNLNPADALVESAKRHIKILGKRRLFRHNRVVEIVRRQDKRRSGKEVFKRVRLSDASRRDGSGHFRAGYYQKHGRTFACCCWTESATQSAFR